MDIRNMNTVDILAELKRRENIKTSADKDTTIVLGSIGNDCGEEYVEIFKEIRTPDDLAFLHTYSLRVRMNSHRNIKGFYFKTTDFKTHEEFLIRDNEGFTKWLRENKHIEYIDL